MYSRYTYSQTISPDDQEKFNQKKQMQKSQQQEREEEIDDLFKIGEKQIVHEHDEAIKKEKKIKKDRKEKKDKKDKKQKKEKKEKKEKREKEDRKERSKKLEVQQISDQKDQESTPLIRECELMAKQKNRDSQDMQKLEKKMRLLSRYQKQLSHYDYLQQNVNALNKQFGLKQKISDDALSLDIIKFGMPELATNGLQDRDVPYYKRHPQLNSVIGMKKKRKKMEKLMRELNMTTNQVGMRWERYDSSKEERYFHFSGYDKLTGIMPERYSITQIAGLGSDANQLGLSTEVALLPLSKENETMLRPTIQFSPPREIYSKLPNSEQKLKMILKEYNKTLNSDPHNTGIWLKFLDAQEKIAELALSNSDISKSQMQRVALQERKLAIIQKGMEKNPNDEDLGLKYLELLFQAKKDRKTIEAETKAQLEIHPNSERLWNFYLHFRLTSLVDFKHSRLQKQFDEITSFLFGKRLNEVKSGKEVWRIRKCGLIILQQVLTVHRLEGYYQLCTAICCALLEFNIFCGEQMFEMSRDERLTQFQHYWQDYQSYKLGERLPPKHKTSSQINLIYPSWEAWRKYNNHDPSSGQENRHLEKQSRYIGSLFKEFGEPGQRWLTSHGRHDQEEISLHPGTFILFEDIELYIQKFQNIENWKIICNMAMNNLNMPEIFVLDSNQNQFLIQWLSQTLLQERSLQSPYHQHSNLMWARFWHPCLSGEFLQIEGRNKNHAQVTKFIYAVNIIESLYLKMLTFHQKTVTSEIGEYLMFLYGTLYYLHSNGSHGDFDNGISRLLSLFSKQTCLQRIQLLLASDPNNINLWSAYIQYERYAGKSVKQCVQCYLSCINTANHPDDKNMEIIKKISALYHLSEFLYRWGYLLSEENSISSRTGRTIVQFVLHHILTTAQDPEANQLLCFQLLFSHMSQLQPLDKLLIGNQLKVLFRQCQRGVEKSQSECFIYYMLLEIGQSPLTIVPLLLDIRNELAVNILIDFNLLQLKDIQNHNLMEYNWNLKFMTYLSRLLAGHTQAIPLFLYQNFTTYCSMIRKKTPNDKSDNFYEEPSKNKLFNWLLILRILQPDYTPKTQHLSQFTQYFLRAAQTKLANINQPACMALLNQILQNSDFSYGWIQNFPYCKSMYLVAGLDPEKRQKIKKLMLEKQIKNEEKIDRK